MALVVKDRVQETSTTTGTGALTLLGAVTGFQTFSSAIGNTNTTYYTIQNGGEWEVGIGTVSAGALSRDTVLESSSGGSLVNFSSGTKFVFCTYPAEKSVDIETAQTLTNKTISADNNTLSGIAASSFVVSNASGNIDGSAAQKAIPSGVVVGTTDSQTLTNKTISGASNTLSSIANASLTNSAITINGTSTSLGGSISVGTVTSVTGTAPVVSSGGNTPAISMAAATTSVNGYLTSTDWNTFNGKQAALVSGTNIKTVNSNSLLGSGNVAVGTVTSVGGTGSYGGLTLSGTVTTSGNITLGGTPTGTWPISVSGASTSCSGNSATATTLIGDQSNWASYRTSAVANMLGWKNYSNGHVIFDASNSTSPTGSAVNNTNAAVAWSATYPTLMGWNGSSTYGVRVDSCRVADNGITTSGSAPYYGARAWVNFNGTGTVAIRGSANVSSITDNGTGNYGINFTTAMPTADYTVVGTCNLNATGSSGYFLSAPLSAAPTTSLIRVSTDSSSARTDMAYVFVAVFC